jgi:DegV family protein with EDD domain
MFTIGNDRVALVTDTSCDLSDEQLAAYDIRLVSLRVATSQGEFRDRVEISQDELYEVLKTEVPKTSLPLPEDVSALYRQLREEGCTRILHIAMSSGLSGTYNMVRILAEDFTDMQIDVYDSHTLSCGLGLLVLEAAEDLTKGMTVEETMEHLDHVRGTQLGTFVIRTLEFLRKGGRIGTVEGVVGTLLQLKPVIFVNDEGVYQTLAKARGFNNALTTMCDEFAKRYANCRVRLAVVHGNAYEDAVKLRDRLCEQMDVVSSFISPVSPALAIHTGPGLLGAIVQFAD